MGKRSVRGVLVGAVLVGLGRPAMGAAFKPGDILVEQIGLSGGGTLGGGAFPVSIEEYTPSGTFVQQVTMPHGSSGLPTSGQRYLTDSGSASSEGVIALAGDQHFVTVAGYNATDGTSGVGSSAGATTSRVVGLVKSDGTVDTSTALSNVSTGNNFRSAVTEDGNEFWTAGAAATSLGYVSSVGATTATALSTQNSLDLGIYNGQLYVTSQKGSNIGVNAVGTGLPTSTATLSLLNGFSVDSSGHPDAFFFASSTVFYVADDRGTAGGLQKWVKSGSTWSLEYTLTPTGTNKGMIGVTGTVSNGVATLYTTLQDGSQVLSAADTLSATSSSTSLSPIITHATNTLLQTVVMAPSPVSLLASDTATLGSVAVNGSLATGYVAANQATGGADIGMLDITGNLPTNGDPVSIFLDLTNNSQTSALASALAGTPGLTVSTGSYSLGNGITYDMELDYAFNPAVSGHDYFDYNFSDIGGGPVGIDNIAVVPEPASVAIALLAIPLLLRRRRI